MVRVIFVFWMLTCIYGNEFIKFNIIKGINPFYTLMAVCIVYSIMIFNNKKYIKGNKQWNKYRNIFVIFCIYTIIFIILSFTNYIRIFNIVNLGYDSSFIIRQSYFIFTSGIGIVIFDCVNKSDIMENVKSKYIIIIFIVISLFRIFGYIDMIPFKAFILVIGSYIYFNRNSRAGIIFIMLSILLGGFDQSTYIIGYIILLVSLIEIKPIIKFIKKYIGFIIYFSITFGIGIFYVFYDKIVNFLYKDPNAIWRWQYWINEIKILINTKLIGVGFGTAYADNNIFSEIYNSNAFVLPADSSYNMDKVLFITAQHNSLLNIFYRLGIIGGILFILINTIPCIWYLKYYFKLELKQRMILKWAGVNFLINLVIIVLNPGMESPRFFLSYIIMISVFVGLLYKYTCN